MDWLLPPSYYQFMSTNFDPPKPDPEVVLHVFRKHVPEVTSGLVKIMGLARQPGRRSVLAVASRNPGGNPVGACVGHRGERIKGIVAELGGEKVDVVLWNSSVERFVANFSSTGTAGPRRLQ